LLLRSASDADTERDVESDSTFNHRTDASDISERGDDEEDDDDLESDISEFGDSIDDKPPPLPQLKISMSEADKASLEQQQQQLLHKTKSESKLAASPEQQRKNEGAMSEVISEGRVKSMIKGFNSGRASDPDLPRSPSTLRISHARSSDGLPSNSKTLKEKKEKKKSKKESMRATSPMRRAATTSSSSISVPASPISDQPTSVSLAAQAAVKVRQRRVVRTGNPNGVAVTGDSEEAPKPKCKTVRVPPAFDPLFYTAERIVHRYFSECHQVRSLMRKTSVPTPPG
jgi:hypothetical protein